MPLACRMGSMRPRRLSQKIFSFVGIADLRAVNFRQLAGEAAPAAVAAVDDALGTELPHRHLRETCRGI